MSCIIAPPPLNPTNIPTCTPNFACSIFQKPKPSKSEFNSDSSQQFSITAAKHYCQIKSSEQTNRPFFRSPKDLRKSYSADIPPKSLVLQTTFRDPNYSCNSNYGLNWPFKFCAFNIIYNYSILSINTCPVFSYHNYYNWCMQLAVPKLAVPTGGPNWRSQFNS